MILNEKYSPNIRILLDQAAWTIFGPEESLDYHEDKDMIGSRAFDRGCTRTDP